jgi:hypothetical protein
MNSLQRPHEIRLRGLAGAGVSVDVVRGRVSDVDRAGE